jgi:hypothetical protein
MIADADLGRAEFCRSAWGIRPATAGVSRDTSRRCAKTFHSPRIAAVVTAFVGAHAERTRWFGGTTGLLACPTIDRF